MKPLLKGTKSHCLLYPVKAPLPVGNIMIIDNVEYNSIITKIIITKPRISCPKSVG